jgi:hypothetical protein
MSRDIIQRNLLCSIVQKIGTFDAPKIIDTRLAEDYARDTALIPSSRRVSHQTVLNTLSEKPQDTPSARQSSCVKRAIKFPMGQRLFCARKGCRQKS